jgi:acyl carrier protein
MKMLQTDTDNGAKAQVTQEEINRIVHAALADVLERSVDEISPESDLVKDLGLDSLGMIRANIAIEEQLGVPILISESFEFALNTVSDLTAFVARRTDISLPEEEQLC